MKNLLNWVMAAVLVCGASVLTACSSNDNNSTNPESEKNKAIDYSVKTNWLSLPKVTKDVDAFYIYSTVYVESSYEEGAPDYAALNNLEMILGAYGEYETNASVFEESCNVFVPWYRQAGMKYAGEVSLFISAFGAVKSSTFEALFSYSSRSESQSKGTKTNFSSCSCSVENTLCTVSTSELKLFSRLIREALPRLGT